MTSLRSTVKRLLGGAYPSYNSYLELLVMTVGSYISDDIGATERKALNDLNTVLHKRAIIFGALSEIRHTITDAENHVDVDVDDCLEQMSELVNELSKLDTTIDIASLLVYVKRKAVEFGDWPIEAE